MNIVQITPGTGGLYCGNCLRDNALVTALRQMGQKVLMVPLYLPQALDEENQSAGMPIFFGGVNVYLEQKWGLFGKLPSWLHNALSSPALLKWASGKAAKTRPEDTGELTVSILRGELGRQARELEDLVKWLKTQPKPDVISLSNLLLTGMGRRFKAEFGVPVVASMQGEDFFLDGLPTGEREQAWKVLGERARELGALIAPSRYYADIIQQRLGLSGEQVRVVHNGINMTGYESPAGPPEYPTVGFFARMSREKGLDLLVEAYILLRKRGRIQNLKLKIGGACTPNDEPFVAALRQRLQAEGMLADVEFLPNITREQKLAFLHSLSVFSVPARYGEAFGLYLLEAWAAGVPVVQPRHGAFPELVEATLGGVICPPEDPLALAEALERLLANTIEARTLGEAGRKSVLASFTSAHMAQRMLKVFEELSARKGTGQHA